jgi:hypothetical protein
MNMVHAVRATTGARIGAFMMRRETAWSKKMSQRNFEEAVSLKGLCPLEERKLLHKHPRISHADAERVIELGEG